MSSHTNPVLNAEDEPIRMSAEAKARLRAKVIAQYRDLHQPKLAARYRQKQLLVMGYVLYLSVSLALVVEVGLALDTLIWGHLHAESGLVIYLTALYLCSLAPLVLVKRSGRKQILKVRP